MNILVVTKEHPTFFTLKKYLGKRGNEIFDLKSLTEDKIDNFVLNKKIEILLADISFKEEEIAWPSNSIFICSKLINYFLELDTNLKVAIYTISLSH